MQSIYSETMNLQNRVKVVVGDITRLAVDAIVNAANEALRGGGGVDGAIHRAAGPKLMEECRSIGSCPTGQARLTKGYLLPAKFVIHTVGPIWEGGAAGEPEALASCYRESLALAASRDVRTIAFPCIATGVYGFPPGKACKIVLETVLAWLPSQPLPEEVTFCCYSESDAEHYRKRLADLSLT